MLWSVTGGRGRSQSPLHAHTRLPARRPATWAHRRRRASASCGGGVAVGLVALSALVFAVPSEAQTNTAPTGKPTIDGTPHAGETLTASVSGIADADGLTNPGYTYQWIRVVIVGGGTSNIAGATASTYTLTGDDVGHTGPGAGDVYRRRQHRRDGDQ